MRYALIALVLLLSSIMFFASYVTAMRLLLGAWGWGGFIAACLAHIVIWLSIASLFDKRHPPPRL